MDEEGFLETLNGTRSIKLISVHSNAAFWSFALTNTVISVGRRKSLFQNRNVNLVHNVVAEL